ncbi:YqaA family protein [Vibrio sp. RC27]
MNETLEALFGTLGLSWEQSAPFTLFLSSFLSATLLPGSSEATLLAALSYSSHSYVYLFIVATLGNTLGGFTNYLLGLWLPNRTDSTLRSRTSIAWLQKHAYWVLLLSWLPIIGDALCLTAGWMRMKALPSFLCILIGKAIRYAILIVLYLGLF